MIPPKHDGEYVARMEDVLEVYDREYDADAPVVCMDEQPVQLLEEVRHLLPMAKGQPKRVDCRRSVILMTGFEPFATFARNPSFDALARATELGLFVDVPADVEILELPVVYGRAFDVFFECVERVRPIAAVSLGVHFGGQTRYRDGVFYPECLARNFDGPTRPDNAGVTRPLAPIVPNAPEAVPSPMAAIVAHHLQSAGYSVEISDDAGAYLCNHIFYTGMHALDIPFGFVHVPPSTDVGGTISPDALAAAMPIIAHAVIAAVPGITRP